MGPSLWASCFKPKPQDIITGAGAAQEGKALGKGGDATKSAQKEHKRASTPEADVRPAAAAAAGAGAEGLRKEPSVGAVVTTACAASPTAGAGQQASWTQGLLLATPQKLKDYVEVGLVNKHVAWHG